jgi:hypothetical protein
MDEQIDDLTKSFKNCNVFDSEANYEELREYVEQTKVICECFEKYNEDFINAYIECINDRYMSYVRFFYTQPEGKNIQTLFDEITFYFFLKDAKEKLNYSYFIDLRLIFVINN